MEFQWLIGGEITPPRQHPERAFSAFVRRRVAAKFRGRAVVGNRLRETVQRAGPQLHPGGIFADKIDGAAQSLACVRRGCLLRDLFFALAHGLSLVLDLTSIVERTFRSTTSVRCALDSARRRGDALLRTSKPSHMERARCRWTSAI